MTRDVPASETRVNMRVARPRDMRFSQPQQQTGFQQPGFWITMVGFWVPLAGFRIPQTKITWILESGLPYMGRMIKTKAGYGQTTRKRQIEYLKDTSCLACRNG